MNGQHTQQKTGRMMTAGGALAAVAILSGSVAITGSTPAAAQTQQSAQSGSDRLPDSVHGIMSRIAEMWQSASQRANDKSLPDGSRASYRASATALRQALTAGGLRPRSTVGGGFDAVSNAQLADDIHALRAAASSTPGWRAANLNQVASLYATGAKEFYTGSLREALLSTSTSSNGTGGNDLSRVAVMSPHYYSTYQSVTDDSFDPPTPFANALLTGPNSIYSSGLAGSPYFSALSPFSLPFGLVTANPLGTVVVGSGGITEVPGVVPEPVIQNVDVPPTPPVDATPPAGQ